MRAADILAGFARQVVEQHGEQQRYTLHPFGPTTVEDEGNVPVPTVHESWNYTLPERYREGQS